MSYSGVGSEASTDAAIAFSQTPEQTGVPLVVDVDGTLIRSDLLWEGVLHLCVRRPTRTLQIPGALIRGRAAFKAFVARESGLPVECIPLEASTLDLVEMARAQGQPIVLATGAHESQARRIGALIQADEVWGSSAAESLTGQAKLRRIRRQYEQYDYVGNANPDVPIWKEARRAFAVRPTLTALWRVRRARPDVVFLASSSQPWKAWFRALRPHQWAKNALLVLPALAAHLPFNAGLILSLFAGLVAFSLLASSVYLVNDIVDVSHDRVHPTKRRRPLAAGDISIPAALAVAVLLMAASLSAAWLLPPLFSVVLAGYFVLTSAYSFVLKRRAVLDVITLAGLYTIRVIAGAALVGIPLSQWFLGFSIFFFFSLALVKRVVELQGRPTDERTLVAGRGYAATDLPVLTSLGTAALAASSLVYCLYITSGDVVRLYERPGFLWIGLPILLYWQARIWLLTGRGVMNEDPVLFALRDRISHMLIGVFLVSIWIAA